MYDILNAKIPDGRVLRQQHRARGDNPHTTYHSVDEAADSVTALCTVRWKDTGSTARLLELIPGPGLDADVIDANRKLITP